MARARLRSFAPNQCVDSPTAFASLTVPLTHSLTHSLCATTLITGVGRTNGVCVRCIRRLRASLPARHRCQRASAAVLASLGRQPQHHGAGRGAEGVSGGEEVARAILPRVGQREGFADAGQRLPVIVV